jgi:hypothetical protein
MEEQKVSPNGELTLDQIVFLILTSYAKELPIDHTRETKVIIDKLWKRGYLIKDCTTGKISTSSYGIRQLQKMEKYIAERKEKQDGVLG